MSTQANSIQEVTFHSAPKSATRHKLPKERKSVTHRFTIEDQSYYLIIGLYPDGSPGEVFIYTSKSGTTIHGLLDTWAITFSIALQHGISLKLLCDKLCFVAFEPAGSTGELMSEFGYAKSVVDHVVRYMAKRFLGIDYRKGNDDEISTVKETKTKEQ